MLRRAKERRRHMHSDEGKDQRGEGKRKTVQHSSPFPCGDTRLFPVWRPVCSGFICWHLFICSLNNSSNSLYDSVIRVLEKLYIKLWVFVNGFKGDA